MILLLNTMQMYRVRNLLFECICYLYTPFSFLGIEGFKEWLTVTKDASQLGTSKVEN